MKLYIQTENGLTTNHPAFEDNLMAAFGVIPSDWEPFVRVERPVPAVYQTLDSQEPVYQKINGSWIDVWSLRNMTSTEKTAKQQAAKAAWAALPDRANFTAWTFDEATCEYKPPTPRPATGDYFWQGTTSSWKVRPVYPTDGKSYKLDFASATWVEITP